MVFVVTTRTCDTLWVALLNHSSSSLHPRNTWHDYGPYRRKLGSFHTSESDRGGERERGWCVEWSTKLGGFSLAVEPLARVCLLEFTSHLSAISTWELQLNVKLHVDVDWECGELESSFGGVPSQWICKQSLVVFHFASLSAIFYIDCHPHSALIWGIFCRISLVSHNTVLGSE